MYLITPVLHSSPRAGILFPLFIILSLCSRSLRAIWVSVISFCTEGKKLWQASDEGSFLKSCFSYLALFLLKTQESNHDAKWILTAFGKYLQIFLLLYKQVFVSDESCPWQSNPWMLQKGNERRKDPNQGSSWMSSRASWASAILVLALLHIRSTWMGPGR